MKLPAVLVALTLLSAPMAQAQPEVFPGIIDSQIEAFRADDMGTAFGFAAPNIQGYFRTPDNFGRMVREGYPMVWRPGSVEYLGAEQIGGAWRQEVLITDAQGRIHKLSYLMIETASGWKIAGVELLTAPEVGA